MYRLPTNTHHTVTLHFGPIFTSKHLKVFIDLCGRCLVSEKIPERERPHLLCQGATIIGLCTLWRARSPPEIHSSSLWHNSSAETFTLHFIWNSPTYRQQGSSSSLRKKKTQKRRKEEKRRRESDGAGAGREGKSDEGKGSEDGCFIV